MKIYCNYILGILFLILGWQGKAQQDNSKELLVKVADYYKKQSEYHVAIQYQMLRGYAGANITESYKGTITKKGTVSRFKVLQSEVLQFEKEQLTIDHGQKLVLYNKTTTPETDIPISIDGFLESFDIHETKEQNGQLVVTLLRMPSTNVFPYNKIILTIDKHKYRVLQQELFFTNKMPFNDEKSKNVPDDARLIIRMEYQDTSVEVLPELQQYLKVSKNQKELTDPYKAYQFIDQTQKR